MGKLFRYNSTSYYDDLAFAAAWLFKATGSVTYRDDAANFYFQHSQANQLMFLISGQQCNLPCCILHIALTSTLMFRICHIKYRRRTFLSNLAECTAGRVSISSLNAEFVPQRCLQPNVRQVCAEWGGVLMRAGQ